MSQVELNRSHTLLELICKVTSKPPVVWERAEDARVELLSVGIGFSIPDRPFGIHRHVHLVHP